MNLNDPFVTLTLTLIHIICIVVGLVFMVLLVVWHLLSVATTLIVGDV